MEDNNTGEMSQTSFPEQQWVLGNPLYQYKGFWFTLPTLGRTQKLLNLHKPLPNDVILASFPKTGTTWLKALLYSIINPSSKSSLCSNHPHSLVPTLEALVCNDQPQASFTIPVSTDSSKRVYSTHIPYQILKDTLNSTDCRVVYVTRNPKDTFISYWHFVQKKKDVPPWPLEDALEKFCRGVFAYGPYHEHVLGYWKESLERPNKVLFLTYEELKDDPKSTLRRLAKFVGCPFGEDDDKHVEDIVSNCSFETLTNYEINKSSDLLPFFQLPLNALYRRGKVGDYKNYLNGRMIKKIDAITLEKFYGSEFVYGI